MATTLANPAIMSLPESETGKSSFPTKLLVVYVFLLYSRIFEYLTEKTGHDLYIMLLLSAIALLFVFLKGEFVRAAKTPAGFLLLAFTFWAGFILPFSDWKSESLKEFTGVWVKALAAFFIIMGLTRTFRDSRKSFSAVAIGGIATSLILLKVGWSYDNRLTAFGTLDNANELAFHLLIAVPFIALLMSRVKSGVWKIAVASMGLLSMGLALKTASRAGLIMMAAILLGSLVKLSFQNKVKIVLVCAIGLLAALATTNQFAIDRYKTIFDSSGNTAEDLSARESAETRKYKLRQGIELTMMHPIFGVGMGVFIPASAELSTSKGEKPIWIASHNTYVQISSETGIVGFLLYVGVLVACFSSLLKLDKQAKRLGLDDVRNQVLCMLLGLVVMCIHFFFDMIGYQYYLPMVAALSTALVYTSRPLIEEAEGRLAGNALNGAGSPGYEEVTVGGFRSFQPRVENSSSPLDLTAASAAASKTASQSNPKSRNPYRFGRRRVPDKH